MNIQMFNLWYWFWVIISIGSTVGLYFLLRHKSQKTQKIVLFSILVLGLIAHFTKFLYPPYSTDTARMLRDAWFVNICGANIGLFPFMFFSKNEKVKDYMFYLGLLGGLIAVLVPLEPIAKVNQAGEWIDIVRFYFHHTMLYAIPLLMVILGLHKLSYKRVFWCPVYLLGVMLFIMLNQIFQSELGFIPLRGDDMLNINYKNSSLIWGPGNESFAVILTALCPKIFKTIPCGQFAGQTKYWPWFWLIVPAFVYLVPICFGICLIFDFKNFKTDFKHFISNTKQYIGKLKAKYAKANATEVNSQSTTDDGPNNNNIIDTEVDNKNNNVSDSTALSDVDNNNNNKNKINNNDSK